ncbi:unnamed protein product [Lepeophtheirus salmonis]|uniref:(salmon louse) hypothetical protein n=1 Tax=Lepeophtheirus salmonis TaxID=72036 RepID=A0A7R8CRG5_LEPSM|nr:unnamed protein product [Lepeophtheirus salmonis]CAF2870401.1 unnamed protein product [Lepeophtheirus salmonis]
MKVPLDQLLIHVNKNIKYESSAPFNIGNIRYITLHNVPFETTTVSSLMKLIIEEIKKSGLPPPFKTYSFDTLKIEHNAFGAKTNDPVINREDDDKLLLSRPDRLSRNIP